jgi:hypothetical protein
MTKIKTAGEFKVVKSIIINPAVWQKLKMHCVSKDKAMGSFLEEIILEAIKHETKAN